MKYYLSLKYIFDILFYLFQVCKIFPKRFQYNTKLVSSAISLTKTPFEIKITIQFQFMNNRYLPLSLGVKKPVITNVL